MEWGKSESGPASEGLSAAVSVCGPVYRMDEQRMQQIASSLVQCARLISRRMGYKAG